MISMLNRIKERQQQLAEQQRQELQRQEQQLATEQQQLLLPKEDLLPQPVKPDEDATMPSVQDEEAVAIATDKKPPSDRLQSRSSHHRKPSSRSRPPKEIHLQENMEAVSPLRLSRSMFKPLIPKVGQPLDAEGEQQQRSDEADALESNRKSPKKKKQRKRQEEEEAADKVLAGKAAEGGVPGEKEDGDDDGSLCSSSIREPDHDASMNDMSWDMTSFLSGEASFTQRLTTRPPQLDGSQSCFSSLSKGGNRRGSLASCSRRGSVASTCRRGSVCSTSLCPSESSTSLEDLEVRSKGTIKLRPSYSEIKGHVVSEYDASKSALIRRFSLDNSNLRGAAGPAPNVDLPSCLTICDSILNGGGPKEQSSRGPCYGIIDKYMRDSSHGDPSQCSVRRCQSYSVTESQSVSEQDDHSHSTSSSANVSESSSSKRVSMVPAGLMRQLKEAYAKRKQPSPDFEVPVRSKSDNSSMRPSSSSESPHTVNKTTLSSSPAPIRSHSNGSEKSKASLPTLSPCLSSPRKPLSNADIFKHASSASGSRKSDSDHSKTPKKEPAKTPKSSSSGSPRHRSRGGARGDDHPEQHHHRDHHSSNNQQHKSPRHGGSGHHQHRSKQHRSHHDEQSVTEHNNDGTSASQHHHSSKSRHRHHRHHRDKHHDQSVIDQSDGTSSDQQQHKSLIRSSHDRHRSSQHEDHEQQSDDRSVNRQLHKSSHGRDGGDHRRHSRHHGRSRHSDDEPSVASNARRNAASDDNDDSNREEIDDDNEDEESDYVEEDVVEYMPQSLRNSNHSTVTSRRQSTGVAPQSMAQSFSIHHNRRQSTGGSVGGV